MGVSAASILNHIIQNVTKATRTHNPDSKFTAKTLTATILSHLRFGRLEKAVSILFASPVGFPVSLYTTLFKICSAKKAIVEARKVESHLISLFSDPPLFLLNRAIETYGKCGCLQDARELFDEMPQRDGGSWNALITAYSKNGRPDKALRMFICMRRTGVPASDVTVASVLSSCASVLALSFSRQVHVLILKHGFQGNVILESSLVDVYGKCCVMSDARRMFDQIEIPNAISWNVIIRRYLEVGEGKEAVILFCNMIRKNVKPMTFTVSNALVACTSMNGLTEGVQIHGFSIKVNVEENMVVSSSLIDMYAKCGVLESARKIFDLPYSKDLICWTSMVSGYAMSGKMREARKLFDEMPERNLISWNAMLAGYTHSFQWDEALNFVNLMQQEIREMDHVTIVLILNVCAAILDLDIGKQVHGYVYRHGFHSNLFVGNALLHMYGKCGNLKKARMWFCQISHLRDRISWNALLTSYAHLGLSEEAMVVFWEMLGETKPSVFTFATLLAACASIFALESGKQIHGFLIRNGYEIDIVVQGALIDMYCKCRRPWYALNVFHELSDRDDVILWNSLMLGCSHNKMGQKVLELFELMEKEGIKPDHITFQAILRACTCEGHVELGRQYFDSIGEKYCIIPRLEHYEAMIALYCQHGLLDEVEEFIKKMPFEPTAPMLTKVLESSQEYKHV